MKKISRSLDRSPMQRWKKLPTQKTGTGWLNGTAYLKHHPTMGTHVSFMFRGYNPYFGGIKPSFFLVLGSKGR